MIHVAKCTCGAQKGATRAMLGQPVLVPGDMGTGSWLLEGMDTNRVFIIMPWCGKGFISVSSKQIDGKALKKELQEGQFTQTLQTSCLKKHRRIQKRR